MKIYRLSRIDVKHDMTLENNVKDYIYIPITDELIKDPFKLEDFSNSLVIFDDIESSEFPKATQKAYNLLDDLIKNGRHCNTAVIFCNQECRMGKRTKPILSMITTLVIFPQGCSLYQTSKLLQQYVGFSKSQIEKVLKINSRWVAISLAKPQYIMHEHGVYMVGKDIY